MRTFHLWACEWIFLPSAAARSPIPVVEGGAAPAVEWNMLEIRPAQGAGVVGLNDDG